MLCPARLKPETGRCQRMDARPPRSGADRFGEPSEEWLTNRMAGGVEFDQPAA
jgi:hypothetical protein